MLRRSRLALLRDRVVAQQRVFAGSLALATGLVQGAVAVALGGVDTLTGAFTVLLTTLGSGAIVVGKRQLKMLSSGSGPTAPAPPRLPTARLL